jgi:twinkle protein
MYEYSAKDIVRQLNQNIDKIVCHLLPNGKKSGHEWCVGSVRGEPGKSLKVCMTGDKTGIWCDFATGENGDLLNLWLMCRSITLREAILEARQYLGIPDDKIDRPERNKYVRPILEGTSIQGHEPYLMSERKLNIETVSAYKVALKGRRIVFPFYRDGELILFKNLKIARVDGKKEIYASENAEPCLFGWQAVPDNTRTLCITEGEIDAMTLFQYGIDMGCVSIPFGGGGKRKQQWIENEFDRLSIYDEIYVCLDNDKEGHIAAAEIIERLGRHRCRLVTLPYKDANECLQKGVTREEMLDCFKAARSLDPDELKRWESYLEQMLNPPTIQAGYQLPWEKTFGKVMLGLAELSVWTGINGHGKSQILGHIVLDCMKQGANVCVASLEIKPLKLLERLTRQASGVRSPTEEYTRAIFNWYGDRAWIFELVGTAKTDRLIDVFRYARKRYGIDVFVVDSLMKCGIAEDDYNAQKAFVEQLCDFKNEYNCHVHLVAHPRKVMDESKAPGKLDVKGSGGIADLADNCFTVWRDKNQENDVNQLQAKGLPIPPDIAQECDCILRCDKQRNGEWEGVVRLWFNRDSFQYLEHHGDRPKQMVEYSKTIHNFPNDFVKN